MGFMKTAWISMAAAMVMSMAGLLSNGAASWPGVATAAAQTAASVEGFRSARFGMTESKVYNALKKDFGLDKDDVTSTQNSIEKTNSLLVSIDNIIPDSGTAVVSYIFGYETEKLIQINVIWVGDADSLASAENLVATGNILRNYFVEQNFPPESMLTNQRLNNGSILMFRGIDGKGRATLLQLNMEQAATTDEGSTSDVKISSLSLSYILDPDAPDIFKVKQGAF